MGVRIARINELIIDGISRAVLPNKTNAGRFAFEAGAWMLDQKRKFSSNQPIIAAEPLRGV